MRNPADDRTRLRKTATIDEQFAVATYEASRNGVVLGTITKYDEASHKITRSLRTRSYRIISWTHSRDLPHEAYETRADCIESLERAAGVAP